MRLSDAGHTNTLLFHVLHEFVWFQALVACILRPPWVTPSYDRHQQQSLPCPCLAMHAFRGGDHSLTGEGITWPNLEEAGSIVNGTSEAGPNGQQARHQAGYQVLPRPRCYNSVVGTCARSCITCSLDMSPSAESRVNLRHKQLEALNFWHTFCCLADSKLAACASSGVMHGALVVVTYSMCTEA